MADFMNTMNGLNGLFRTSRNNRELLNGIANVAQQSTNSKVVLMNANGKIVAGESNVPENLKSSYSDAWFINKNVCDQLNSFNEKKQNINLTGLESYTSAVIPIQNGGSMILFKQGSQFTDDEMNSADLCANNASMVALQDQYEAEAAEARETKIANDVLNSLSFTEIDVIAEVFDYIKDDEGFIVASKIADKNGYARSVTVNALRKLESAGVVQTRSLGVKGTYIKVLNKKLCHEINKFRKKK